MRPPRPSRPFCTRSSLSSTSITRMPTRSYPSPTRRTEKRPFATSMASVCGCFRTSCPAFALARTIYTMTRDRDWTECDGMILMNHGAFTFADDAKSSYERMIELVSRAEKYVAARTSPPNDACGASAGGPGGVGPDSAVGRSGAGRGRSRTLGRGSGVRRILAIAGGGGPVDTRAADPGSRHPGPSAQHWS